ncbi:MAG: DNA methylase [Ruminococcus sp.]|jgi:DNA polymerase V
MEGHRTYIAIDLKSFYASVECVERKLDPLTANLVVADSSRTEKTICLAVSPSLKKYGLSGRSRLFEVQHTLKKIENRTGRRISYITAPPRMTLYMKYSGEIYSIYLKYIGAEDIHVYSIDECFLDVTDYLSLYRMNARQLTKNILLDIQSTTGIPATAGIGTNLYLCKIALDIVAKHIDGDENGVRIGELDEYSYRSLLWDYRPITDFWRIGKGTARTLEKNHIYTMGDLAEASICREDWLYKTFGIDAEILIDHAWGYEPCTMKDIKAYHPKTNSLGSGQVLPWGYSYEKAKMIVLEMTDELILDLMDKNLAADSFTLHISYDRENINAGAYQGKLHTDHYGRQVPQPAHGTANLESPTSSSGKIMDAVMNLYDRIIDPALLVRRISLTANRVVDDSFTQLNLFCDPHRMEKEKNLQHAVLEIRKKFGKNAILRGTSLQQDATAVERHGQIGGHRA